MKSIYRQPLYNLLTQRSPWLQQLLLSSILVLTSTPIAAQITPDNTLGAENSRLTPNVQVDGAAADRIDGGATRGGNLFHSFSQFNVGDGQRVYFGNSNGIQNILTRVTGGNASNILGTLGVEGGANLFLLNPNGIIFGQNASLDVRGSFVGTTANAFQFGNQGNFSATNPQAPPLLTVQPSALLFNQINNAALIQNNSRVPAGKDPAGVDVFGLRVPDGKSLLLVGGNVSMDGGWAIASGGRIELGGLTEAGSVGIQGDGNQFSLSFPEGVQRGDISLTNGAVVGVTGSGDGSIAINARNLDILAGSELSGGIGQGLGTTGTQAGNITVDATGQIKLAGTNSRIFAGTGVGAVGRGGDITIKAGEIAVENSGFITSETYGKGDAGDIIINTKNLIVRDSQLGTIIYGEGNAGDFKILASDSVELSGEIPGDRFPGGILATIDVTGKGKGGSIYLETKRLSVSDGSKVQTATFGEGDAGNLFIRADEIDVFETEKPNFYSTSIFAAVGLDPRAVKPSKGNGGNLTIETRNLSIRNGGNVDVSTQGEGNGGQLFIKASDSIEVTGNSPYASTISAEVTDRGVGNGGSITIETPKLSIKDGGEIAAFSNGKGDAGNISITATDAISLDASSYIYNNLQSRNAIGNAGKIDITTGSLSVTNGSQINSFTRGQGNAGDITIQARDAVTFDGLDSNSNYSSSSSSVRAGGVGNGGNINITGRSLSLTNGAELNASVSAASDSLPGGNGKGGSVNINLDETLTIADGNQPGIFASLNAGGVGSGGDINIQAGNLVVQNGGQINSSTFGQGDSGNISITADNSISLDASDIVNNVGSIDTVGNAGKIDMTTGSLSATNGSQINSFTRGQGNAGDITIQVRDTVTFDGVDSDGFASGSFSSVETGAVGNGGSINITAGSLSLTNSGTLGVSIDRASEQLPGGKGIGGNININVRDAFTISGTGSGIDAFLGSGAVGQSGDVNIQAENLFIKDSGGINSNTFGKGNGGSITVEAKNLVEILSDGALSSDVQEGAIGNAGDITIKTGSLIVRDSQIGPSTFGEGNAGNFKIIASDSVELSGQINRREGDTSNEGSVGFPGGLFAQVDLTGKGQAGNLTIETRRLSVSDGSKIQAATFGDGDAGNIFIRADEIDLFETEKPNFYNTGIFAGVQTDGRTEFLNIDLRDGRLPQGKGGNLTIETRKLNLRNGPEVFVQTTGVGDAGEIFIRASEAVNVTGVSTGTLERQRTSQITAGASERSTGNGGSLTIETPLLNVADGGIVSSSSQGTGKGGDINITGDFARLNNGQISAQTASTDGGNINLNLSEYLLLRNNSIVSTTAGTAQAGGNGGNITINTPFIVAVPNENSDITANAFSGRGGNVSISAESIFGIQARSLPTLYSDITASSELGVSGQISITELNVQPTQGLVELPGQILDASDQIAQTCPNGATANRSLGEFVVTGRGSLPPNPLEPIAGTTSLSQLATLDGESTAKQPNSAPAKAATSPNTIVEAQGWVKTADGKIALVANVPEATPAASSTTAACPQPH